MAWERARGEGARGAAGVDVDYAQMNAGPLGAALMGLLTFLALYGPAALDPTRIRWLIRDDFSQHLLGWFFFRNTPLGLPLGAIPGYVHPLGTTLGYTDSIPWAGLLLRPLSGLLPADFQYIGPWLCLCLMLQGAVAAWVARRLGATTPLQWLTGALLVLSPALLARMGMAHEALCAHWALVLLVGLNLLPQPDARDARRALGVALALCVFAAGVHPVIAAMVLPLALALCVRTALEGQLGWRGPALIAAASVACVLGLFYAFGYLGTGAPVGGNTFGDYSADLATFINPSGYRDVRWSRFLPALPRNEGQYEGFAYLGLGCLFALRVGLVLAGRRARDVVRHWRRLLPVALVALGLGISALYRGIHHTRQDGRQPAILALLAGIGLTAGGIGAGFWVRGLLNRSLSDLRTDALELAVGARNRVDLTATIAMEVTDLVTRLRDLDERILAGTVALMLDEYNKAADAKDRQSALMNVVSLSEKLGQRLSPWYVRYKDVIASAVAVAGAVSGLLTAIRAFM